MARKVVTFHYSLTNVDGDTIDSSKSGEPFSFLEGAAQIIPGLEKAMLDLKAGDKKKIRVQAAEAYGERAETMVVKVPREKLPTQEIRVGDRFRGGPDEHSPVFMVKEVTDTIVTLDGNHPLAGQDLNFAVEIVDVREATAEELSHGHVHGEGGHHHH